MTETKKVVVLNGEILHVGELETLPEGAILEEREMVYTLEYGWREVDWVPEPTYEQKLQADVHYIAIMTGVEL